MTTFIFRSLTDFQNRTLSTLALDILFFRVNHREQLKGKNYREIEEIGTAISELYDLHKEFDQKISGFLEAPSLSKLETIKQDVIMRAILDPSKTILNKTMSTILHTIVNVHKSAFLKIKYDLKASLKELESPYPSAFVKLFGQMSKLYEKSLFQGKHNENLVIYFNQTTNKFINLEIGWCHGIAAVGSTEILKHGKFFKHSLDEKQSYDPSMAFLEGSYKSVVFNQHFQRADQPQEQQEQQILYSFEQPIASKGKHAAKTVANQLKTYLETLEMPHYAINFSMQGRSHLTIGHSTAIIRKNDSFYFLDANVGLYRFGNADELTQFIDFLLREFKYAHLYQFSLLNFPHLKNLTPYPAKENFRKDKYAKQIKLGPHTPINWSLDQISKLYFAGSLIKSHIRLKNVSPANLIKLIQQGEIAQAHLSLQLGHLAPQNLQHSTLLATMIRKCSADPVQQKLMLPLINTLLDKNNVLESIDGSSERSLIIAAKYGNQDVVEKLLEKNVQIDHQDTNGNTALMVAAEHGQLEILEMLLAHGADPALTNGNNQTAQQIYMMKHSQTPYPERPETDETLDDSESLRPE